ncbi:plasmid fertility inhibition factor family protein (plasmid) [Robbsia andropogonis]|uniref:plasmid fertility inhibition factor family protein n=1 Tax=Robbsia andropogonis TaxID=28092 RepID=UPI003D1FB5AC
MNTFSHVATMHNLERNAIFRVQTDTRGDVWMRVTEGTEKMIVEVDAVRFLEAWLLPGSSHRDVALRGKNGWSKDYKFRYAEEGFSRGWVNPVPLAEVCAGHWNSNEIVKRDGFFDALLRKINRKPNGPNNFLLEPKYGPYVAFTDGVTRTIWLLNAGVARFPVSCSRRNANELHSLAGVADSQPIAVSELIPELEHIEKLKEYETYKQMLLQHGLPEYAW